MRAMGPGLTVAEARQKWNRRYQERRAEGSLPQPNPLAVRLRDRLRAGLERASQEQGGRPASMLDAACGLGAGLAAVGDCYAQIVAVDLSDEAVRSARGIWRTSPLAGRIQWLVADAAQVAWRPQSFDLVCAFGFTDWGFLARVPRMVKPGGMVLYQGFARRQLEVKPTLDPDWTSTPEALSALFEDWEVVVCEESADPPYRLSFAAERPG